MTTLQQRIEEFDAEGAGPRDLAVLLEDIFMNTDPRVRGGGPIITAMGVIKRYEEAVRTKAAPELHARAAKHCMELRSTLLELESSLRRLEKDGKTG
jgi:hypothetical protein